MTDLTLDPKALEAACRALFDREAVAKQGAPLTDAEWAMLWLARDSSPVVAAACASISLAVSSYLSALPVTVTEVGAGSLVSDLRAFATCCDVNRNIAGLMVRAADALSLRPAPAAGVTEEAVRAAARALRALYGPAYDDDLAAEPDARNILTAAAPLMGAVPEGWKLVPVEPTLGMLDAAHEAWTPGVNYPEAQAIRYRAMLSAAPTPPRGE